MKLTQILGLASITALAACGGGGSKGGDTTPPEVVESAPAGPEDHYKACGIWTTRDSQLAYGDKSEDELTDADYEKMNWDPMTQTPKDTEACMEFVRFVFSDLTDTMQLVAASDIAYGLCDGEAAVGEACYFKARYYVLSLWLEQYEDYDPNMVRGYLEAGCELQYQIACQILETGVDAEGRTWLEVEEDGAEGGIEGGVPGGMYE